VRPDLRPATDADRPFLLRVFASTREAELAVLGEAMIGIQFDLQDRSYRQSHPEASFDVIVVDGEPAGRLYVDRGAESIHVIDISLLPEHRGQGIGAHLLRSLLDEGPPVTLAALRGSDALRLYERLGFEIVREGDVYIDLQANTA
jgi:ribosomal protein S18 acetylase RimI-like enzyme